MPDIWCKGVVQQQVLFLNMQNAIKERFATAQTWPFNMIDNNYGWCKYPSYAHLFPNIESYSIRFLWNCQARRPTCKTRASMNSLVSSMVAARRARLRGDFTWTRIHPSAVFKAGFVGDEIRNGTQEWVVSQSCEKYEKGGLGWDLQWLHDAAKNLGGVWNWLWNSVGRQNSHGIYRQNSLSCGKSPGGIFHVFSHHRLTSIGSISMISIVVYFSGRAFVYPSWT